MRSAGGHPDDAIGFPGATDYLAKHLPNLKGYSGNLATKLVANHAH